MTIPLVQVAGKITAAVMNQVITGVNQTALAGVVPSSAANGTVSPNGKVTFNNQSTVSLNGVFSGSYDNYRIVINSPNRSNASGLNIRFRSAGNDDTGSDYWWIRTTITGTSSAVTSSSSGTSATIDQAAATANQTADGYFDVFGPASGLYTSAAGIVSSIASGTPSGYDTKWGCSKQQAFDGFTLFPFSGTFTGTLRVYGYNNLT